MALSEETQVRIVFAPLEEAGKFVRLILGLSTGAVVVFTNLLVSAKFPRWLLAILAASLVMFGLSAAMRLFIIFKLQEAHAIFAKIFTEESMEGAGRFKPLIEALVESVTVWLANTPTAFEINGIASVASTGVLVCSSPCFDSSGSVLELWFASFARVKLSSSRI